VSIIGLARTVAPATSSCPGHAGDSDVAQQTGLSGKAYCGPAHTWTLDDRSSWPARVVLTCGEGQYEYHLVRDPTWYAIRGPAVPPCRRAAVPPCRRAAVPPCRPRYVGNIVYMPLQ